ncbi:MAG TPA: glycosyltransferase family 39 protein [Phototrophicaceae bacterium]|nr:glycosyltransferase family 39 protein [Phototrophicaceae bacterium]
MVSAAHSTGAWLRRHRLHLILVLALMLRLGHLIGQDPLAAYAAGGDSRWYLLNGYALVTGFEQGQVTIPGLPGVEMPVILDHLPTPPVYLLLLGFWQALLPPAAAVRVLQLLQVGLSIATIYLAYRLARTLSGAERAGLITAGVLAVSPAFVIEPSLLVSETVYMFLVSAALSVYVPAFAAQPPPGTGWAKPLALAAVLLGLAALTRAPLLLFPVGLALHLLLACGWREGLKRAALLLVLYVLVVSTWTIYNRARWGRWVIGAEGLAAFVFIGATDWNGPEQVDENLAATTGSAVPRSTEDQQELYQQAAAQIIGSDLGGYFQRRVSDLAAAYLQPHGTLYYGGESLKDLLVTWLQTDQTPGGLLRLTQGDWFWPKLVIYGFHYSGLLFGLVGMWVSRRNWRATLPLAGLILYLTLVHLVLDALPRYLFPTLIFWWVFAGMALSRWWPRRKAAAP